MSAKGLALVISVILLVNCPTLPSVEEVDYIIEEIDYCIEIHEWYIENNYHRKYTGNIEWHQRWINTYNRTLEILHAYRHLIRMLSLEPPRLTAKTYIRREQEL